MAYMECLGHFSSLLLNGTGVAEASSRLSASTWRSGCASGLDARLGSCEGGLWPDGGFCRGHFFTCRYWLGEQCIELTGEGVFLCTRYTHIIWIILFIDVFDWVVNYIQYIQSYMVMMLSQQGLVLGGCW